MQNIAVNNFLEAYEAQNNVHAIKLEIEAITVKSQFEETFLRFPHIAEQILETLDVQSLSKCQEVNKCWQNFIYETKPFNYYLKNHLRTTTFKPFKNWQIVLQFLTKKPSMPPFHLKKLHWLNLRDQPFSIIFFLNEI